MNNIKWIAIKKGLPEQEGKYLCFSEEGVISIERYNIHNEYIYCDSTDSGYATHWAELPEPPKE